jgi:cobyrinic acid a,c-diamide synthase
MSTRAFLLAGTHSGCGKSTLAAGLLRAFRLRGRAIAPFKAGPDYLDPMLHAVAAGRASWNLDPFFQDAEGLRESVARGAAGAELALVEGVMGLFDGADPVSFAGSGADLARRLGLPVVLVVDGGGSGGSVAATVLGHARLWPDLDLAGVVLNRLGGPRHAELQRAAIAAHAGVPVLGWVPKRPDWRLPERHLGIHQPHELPGLEAALDRLAAGLAETVDLAALARVAQPLHGLPSLPARAPAQEPVRVALARDEAFTFTYADTLERLERLGVRWVPFSPLRERLPTGVAGVYLPGGYPELHAEALSRNGELHAGLRAAHEGGMPILAECGGYMALGEALVDLEGRAHPMAGVIPGRFRMTGRLQSFGYKRLRALGDSLLAPAGSTGKAHEFHHSVREDTPPRPAWRAEDLQGQGADEGHAEGALLATYAHLHFGANPGWAEAWVARLRAFQSGAAPS